MRNLIPHHLTRTVCRAIAVPQRWKIRRSLARLRDSREACERQQVLQLRGLLVHAGQHVPYYRALFRDLHFNPAATDSLGALEQLPVLTKDIVRSQAQAMVSETFHARQLMQKSTGGSTGEPLVFYRHREYLAAARLGTFRNLALCGWHPGDPVANFWGINDPATYGRRALKEELNMGFYTFNAFDAGDDRFAEWRIRLERLQPVVFYGYASTLWLFARWWQRHGGGSSALRRLKGVFLTAERLHAFQRQAICDTFGAPVFNLYGSTEIQNIAFECVRGAMHIASDYVVVESEGTPGSPGPLLLTSLHNYAMPFIRYRNGDEGSCLGYTCDCGINTPCLSLDISRSCDNFRTRSGRVIHGEFFTHAMEGIREVRLFQFRQVAIDRVELSVVAQGGARAAAEKRVDGVIQAVTDKTCDELALTVRWVDRIEPTSRGKHLFTVCELDDAG